MERVEVIARKFIAAGLTWQDLDSDEARDAGVQELLSEIEATLTDVEKSELAGYAEMFARHALVDEAAIAKAKLALWLERKMGRIVIEKATAKPTAADPVFRTYPKLFSEIDDAGLVPVSLLTPLRSSFRYNDHVLLPLPWTPRGLCHLLVELARKGEETAQNLRVRLDYHRLVPRAEYREPLQEAILYGPPFQDARTFSRQYATKTSTVLTRMPEGDLDSEMAKVNPIERLEVTRKEEDGRVALLFEELRPQDKASAAVGYGMSRIFHSDISPKGDVFFHADTSQLVYSSQRYSDRLAVKAGEKFKADHHVKLYKLTNCSVDVWRRLLRESVPRDELVDEFLTGKRHPIIF